MITRDPLNNAFNTMGIYTVSTDHSNCIHDDRNDDDREQMLTISSEEFVLKCKTYNLLYFQLNVS